MYKRILCGALALTMAAAPVMARAECFTEAEWKAAHVRVMQTDLQVAALECANVEGHSYTEEYNTFIKRFSDRLIANAKLLKAHFQRVYGAGSGPKLDVFVTKVANDSSSRSMSDMLYCANSADMFKAALALEKAELEQMALERVKDHSEIGEVCPAKPAPVVAATKSPKKVATK